MPTRKKSAVPRAPRGSIADSILVRLDAELSRAVRAAAEREGCSVGEWMRRAARDRALRQEWERMQQKK